MFTTNFDGSLYLFLPLLLFRNIRVGALLELWFFGWLKANGIDEEGTDHRCDHGQYHSKVFQCTNNRIHVNVVGSGSNIHKNSQTSQKWFSLLQLAKPLIVIFQIHTRDTLYAQVQEK